MKSILDIPEHSRDTASAGKTTYHRRHKIPHPPDRFSQLKYARTNRMPKSNDMCVFSENISMRRFQRPHFWYPHVKPSSFENQGMGCGVLIDLRYTHAPP
ncbi:unnamed protein product [Ectocarpus sp. 12 AP-2014]